MGILELAGDWALASWEQFKLSQTSASKTMARLFGSEAWKPREEMEAKGAATEAEIEDTEVGVRAEIAIGSEDDARSVKMMAADGPDPCHENTREGGAPEAEADTVMREATRNGEIAEATEVARLTTVVGTVEGITMTSVGHESGNIPCLMVQQWLSKISPQNQLGYQAQEMSVITML